MKKRLLYILLSYVLLVLSGCSSIEQKNDDSSQSTTSMSDVVTLVPDSSDLKGEPNEELVPEISNKEINDFSAYDELSDEEKNDLIYNYLLKTMSSIGGSESGAKELLSEYGYSSSDTKELSELLDKLKIENPNDNFETIIKKLVEQVMTK